MYQKAIVYNRIGQPIDWVRPVVSMDEDILQILISDPYTTYVYLKNNVSKIDIVTMDYEDRVISVDNYWHQ